MVLNLLDFVGPLFLPSSLPLLLLFLLLSPPLLLFFSLSLSFPPLSFPFPLLSFLYHFSFPPSSSSSSKEQNVTSFPSQWHLAVTLLHIELLRHSCLCVSHSGWDRHSAIASIVEGCDGMLHNICTAFLHLPPQTPCYILASPSASRPF